MHVIIGPGATGGLLAATLVKSGASVALVCRDAARAAKLRKSGIEVAGATTTKVPGKAFAAITHDPKSLSDVDTVFICVKSHDAASAIREARVVAKQAKAVVSLLNGLAHVSLFRKQIPPPLAVHGVGYFSAFRTGHGKVRHAGGNTIRVAQDGKWQASAEVAAILSNAGWSVDIVSSVDRLLWTKLVLNAAINPLAALAGQPNGVLAGNAALAELLGRAASEGEAVMQASGIEPLESPLPEFAAELCRKTSENVNSMLADLRAGRRTELDAILRPILDAAKRRKVETPVLSSLYDWTKALSSSFPPRGKWPAGPMRGR